MKKLMYFAAALLVLVGCNKNDNIVENAPEGTPFEKGQKVTLTIGTGAQQGPNKVAGVDNTIDDQIDFTWEEGDQILVKVGENTATFTLSSGAGLNEGEFAGEMPAGGSTFDIQYPVEAPDLTAQEYTEDKVIPADKMAFAAEGCVLGTTAILKAQYAMVQLNLYGTDMTIGKIVFKNITAEPAESYTLTLPESGVEIGANSEEATPFYMVVPAGEYQFEVEVYDAAATPAKICSFATSAAQTFVADKCLNMPAKEVKAAPQEVEWTNYLSLGRQTATAIVIETGVDVNGYTADATHQMLDDAGFLWAYLDGTTLRIQTPASQINSSLENLFDGCRAESITGLGNIHATTAKNMFHDCHSLTNIDFTGFNTEDVTDMSHMFEDCGSLPNIDFTGFNTEDVTDMSHMFAECCSLTSLNLSGFNTAKVMDMGHMFESCRVLKSLTLSNDFKVASRHDMMFFDCGNDCTVYGVTDDGMKEALKNDTDWDENNMHFDEE